MKDKFTSFMGSVKSFWNGTSKKMRVLFLSVAAGILAISLAVVLFLNRSDYIVLTNSLTTEESAEVMAQLQEMGVEGRLDGNRLMIPKDDEMTVRMQLAARGLSGGDFSYDIFEGGNSLTDTASDKKQRNINQLQNRLQETILTFPEVTQAVVTISIPETNTYVLESQTVEPSASVKLQVRAGRSLTTEQIQGIVNIVRDSVPGLSEQNISVSDQTGDLLGSLVSGRDAASAKLTLTEQVNDTVKRRVMSMIVPLYGDGKVNVAVNTVLDTDQRITEENTYLPIDPEDPTNNPIDYFEAARERSGGGAGVAVGVPGATDNIQVPEYTGLDADAGDAEYYSTHDVYDYLVSSVKSQIVKEGLEITDMTVAVIVDAQALPDGQRDQVIDLVATTAGVPRDKVSVQAIQFNVFDAEGNNGEVVGEGWPWQLVAVIALGAVALLFLIVMLILSAIRKSKRKKAEAAALAAEADGTLVDLVGQEEGFEFEPITLPETPEQKLKAQIKDLADSDPEIVAQLIKTWLVGTTG